MPEKPPRFGTLRLTSHAQVNDNVPNREGSVAAPAGLGGGDRRHERKDDCAGDPRCRRIAAGIGGR